MDVLVVCGLLSGSADSFHEDLANLLAVLLLKAKVGNFVLIDGPAPAAHLHDFSGTGNGQ